MINFISCPSLLIAYPCWDQSWIMLVKVTPWSGSSLVQIMTHQLFSAKPVPKTVLPYCQCEPYLRFKLQWNLNQTARRLLSENVFENALSKNVGDVIQGRNVLTHWGRVTHICVSKLTIIGSDNGLSPGRRQVSISTDAGILLIGLLGKKTSVKS